MTSELSTATDTAGLLMLDIHVAAMSVLLRRLDALLLEGLAAALPTLAQPWHRFTFLSVNDRIVYAHCS